MKVNVTSVVNQNIRLDINREFLDIFLGSGYTPSNVRLKRFHPIAKSILTSFPTLNNLLLNVFERSKPANHIFTKEKRKVKKEKNLHENFFAKATSCEVRTKFSQIAKIFENSHGRVYRSPRFDANTFIGRANPPRNPFVSLITHSRDRPKTFPLSFETFNSW